MHRLALAGLLAISLMEMIETCPLASKRLVEIDGKQVTEWYSPEGHLLGHHQGDFRCFGRALSCKNGYYLGNQCLCLPGTVAGESGVCEPICPDCENGWCSSETECRCFKSFEKLKGRCVPSESLLKRWEPRCDKCPSCDPSKDPECYTRRLPRNAGQSKGVHLKILTQFIPGGQLLALRRQKETDNTGTSHRRGQRVCDSGHVWNEESGACVPGGQTNVGSSVSSSLKL